MVRVSTTFRRKGGHHVSGETCVNTAHLLRNHHDESSERSTADTWDGEELDDAGEVGALANDGSLFQKLSMDVVQITSSLKPRSAKDTSSKD